MALYDGDGERAGSDLTVSGVARGIRWLRVDISDHWIVAYAAEFIQVEPEVPARKVAEPGVRHTGAFRPNARHH